MVKLVDKQNIFNSGILSSKLHSRDDLKQYNNGIADALNFICSRYGPMEKRTGTQHIWNLGNPDAKVFLMPFIFSIKQTILLEFLDREIRFYTFGTDENNNFGFGPLVDTDGTQYTIRSPFTDDMLDEISYAQSLDVLYLAFSSGKYPPYTVTRKGNLNWVIEEFETEDGPYLDQNYNTQHKMTIQDTNTTTSTVSLSNFSLSEADVGRWIRICTPRYNENTYAYEDKWSYGKIASIGNPIWVLSQRTVYTKVENPANGAAVYSNSTLKTQWGSVSERTISSQTNTFKDYGRTFSFVDEVAKGVYEWKEVSRTCYLNPEDIATVENNIVYTRAASPSNGATIYSDSDCTVSVGTTTSATGTEDTTKYFTANKDNTSYKYLYVGTVKSGSSTFYEWKQARYIYSNSTYETVIGTVHSEINQSSVSVQLDDVTQTTGSFKNLSTFNQVGTSITVNWTYRNTVEEQDQSWMTAATSEWRLGVWHSETGNNDYPVTYPSKVTIHQQRLVWAGMTDRPWIWTSNSFAYKNYAPSDYEGDIADTNSIYYDISSSKISEIFWLRSLKHLLIGTEMGEIRMYSAGTAITPSDVVSNMESSYGSHNSEPIVNDDNIVFIQRLQRTVRSLSYDYNQDAFVGPELTVLAEGLTVGGVKKIAFQKEPNNTYWCLKEDGSLLSLTYDKAQDVIGWSQSRLAGTDVKVIDIAVLPSNAYMQDVLILCTERTYNDEIYTTIRNPIGEYIIDEHLYTGTVIYSDEECTSNTGYVKTIDIGTAEEVEEFTALKNGSEFKYRYNGEGIAEGHTYYKWKRTKQRHLELLSRNFNKDIAQKDVLYLDDAVRIKNEEGMTDILGLDYLEGETVRVMDEGAYEGDYVVEDGAIHLNTNCKDIWIGLPYESYFETLERDFQDKQLSTKMSKLRVYKLRMYIERSLGISIKRLERGTETKLITFDPTQNMDEVPELITGVVDIPVSSAWDCDYRLKVMSESGFPCTVSGIIIGLEINAI